MAQNKGITIEFRGDTSKLDQALRKVKNETKATQTALREVDRALKFNPHNVELLTQKQRLLKQRVEETAAKVKSLKDIQKQLDADKTVDKNGAEYQKLRRDILVAENQLKHFNKEMIKFGNAKLNAVGQQIQNVGSKLTSVNRAARRVLASFAAIALYKGFERLKTLDEVSVELQKLGYEGERLDNAMQAATESVSGTKFALTDMAKVMKGALGSGVTETYDLQEYLTRTADLAQLAGIDVQRMGAMMNKAYSKGKVDARLLNQLNANGIPIYKLLQNELGVSADKLADMTKAGQIGFDDLYKATDKYKGLAQEMGTETFTGAFTVLTQQFGLIGADFLSGVYEPIKEGTKGIVETIKELRSTGYFKDLGKNFAEFMKPFAEFVKDILKAGAALPTSIKQFGLFFSLFGGPALKAIGSMTIALGQFQKRAEKAGINLSKLASGGQIAGAFGLIAVNVGLAAVGIHDLITGTTEWTKAYEENAAARKQTINDINAQAIASETYAQSLDALVAKEDKSAEDKAKIKMYVDLLNQSIDGLNLVYDEEADKLNKSTDEIYQNIDAMKEQALQAAYTEAIADATKDLVEAEAELGKKQEHLRKTQELYNEAVRTGNQAGIKQFGEEINRTQREINGLDRVINGSKKEIDTYGAAYSKAGKKVGKDFAEGVESGKGKARSAAKKVSSAAKDGLDTSGAYTIGANWTRGIANGISGAISWVTSAVNKVNREIKKTKTDLKEHSPSKVAEEIGAYWTQGIAIGMQKNIGDVMRASDLVSAAVVGGAQYITNNERNNNLNANYTIIVNGSNDPEAYGRYLANGLKQGMRTI